MLKKVSKNSDKKEESVQLFVLFDLLAEEPGPIFQAVNEKVAGRKFKELIMQAAYKEDFVLYRVGYFTKDMELIPELHLIDIYMEEKDEKSTLQKDAK